MGSLLRRSVDAVAPPDAGHGPVAAPAKAKSGRGGALTKGSSGPAKGSREGEGGKTGAFVKGRHGTKITLEYGD